MTVEHVRTSPARRPDGRAGRLDVASPAYPPTPRSAPEGQPTCLVVPEIADGEGAGLVRTLRRRESTRAVLLTRRAGRRELLVLLSGGIRGAVTSDVPGAARIANRPAPLPQQDGVELTPRELGVLRLVADGRTNRQIGERLELSALTVKSHLARISRKVGTGDRAEMVAYAIRRDLLS